MRWDVLMMQVLKIVLTVMVVAIIAVGAWAIIDEIIHFNSWKMLGIALFWFILGILDFWLLWFA